MYKADIRVKVQVQENYNWAQGGDPYWEMKGEIEFLIPQVDVEAVVYADTGVVESVIQSMLDDKSRDTINIKYTLIIR